MSREQPSTRMPADAGTLGFTTTQHVPSKAFRRLMKNTLALAAALLALSLTTGCASMADATAARGTGMTHVYDQPYDTVWDALTASVKETDLSVVSEDKATGTLLAKRSMTAF